MTARQGTQVHFCLCLLFLKTVDLCTARFCTTVKTDVEISSLFPHRRTQGFQNNKSDKLNSFHLPRSSQRRVGGEGSCLARRFSDLAMGV